MVAVWRTLGPARNGPDPRDRSSLAKGTRGAPDPSPGTSGSSSQPGSRLNPSSTSSSAGCSTTASPSGPSSSGPSATSSSASSSSTGSKGPTPRTSAAAPAATGQGPCQELAPASNSNSAPRPGLQALFRSSPPASRGPPTPSNTNTTSNANDDADLRSPLAGEHRSRRPRHFLNLTWGCRSSNNNSNSNSNDSDSAHARSQQTEANAQGLSHPEISSNGASPDADPTPDAEEVTPTHYSTPWLLLGVLSALPVTIFLGRQAAQDGTNACLLTAHVVAILLLLFSRWSTTKKRPRVRYADIRSPADESDVVPRIAIWSILGATVLYGSIMGSLFLDKSLPRKEASFALRCSAVTMYAFHRILRPADRLDPLRTALELEALEIAFDALDGAAFLDDDERGGGDLRQAFVACGVLWYVMISIRVIVMGLMHLPPRSPFWRFIRLGTRRFRSRVAKIQAIPGRFDVVARPDAREVCERNAIAVWLRLWILAPSLLPDALSLITRLLAWSRCGREEAAKVQQEFMMKNAVGIWRACSAVGLYMWYPPIYPSKYADMIPKISPVNTAWLYLTVAGLAYVVVSFLLTDAVASLPLRGAAPEVSFVNCGFDVFLVGMFGLVLRRLLKHRSSWRTWLLFSPDSTADSMTAAAVWSLQAAPIFLLSLTSVRLPILFHHARSLPVGQGWPSFEAVVGILNGLTVPMMAYCSMASTFTTAAQPDNTISREYPYCWNPSTWLVSQSQFAEAVLDIASSVEFFRYSTSAAALPPYFMHILLTFCVLELWSALLCYASASTLLMDHFGLRMGLEAVSLVRAKAFLRFLRLILDLGACIVRLILWLNFGQPFSLFLVKSAVQILHAIALVERGLGVEKVSSPYNLRFDF